MQPPDEDAHWRRNLRLTAGLLAAWFVATFVVAWFGRDLSFEFFGWPFSFWVAAQGAPLAYLAIVWWYARAMDRLDRQHGLDEADPP